VRARWWYVCEFLRCAGGSAHAEDRDERVRPSSTKAELTTTSLHATRHTAATNLIAGGVDIRTAASVLGHVNANVTLSIYAHVVEGAERAAVDVLAGRPGRAVVVGPARRRQTDCNRSATAGKVAKKKPVTTGLNWLRGLDLNQGPSGYEPDDLGFSPKTQAQSGFLGTPDRLPDCSTPRLFRESPLLPYSSRLRRMSRLRWLLDALVPSKCSRTTRRFGQAFRPRSGRIFDGNA
jgi:Phage integrase family